MRTTGTYTIGRAVFSASAMARFPYRYDGARDPRGETRWCHERVMSYICVPAQNVCFYARHMTALRLSDAFVRCDRSAPDSSILSDTEGTIWSFLILVVRMETSSPRM